MGRKKVTNTRKTNTVRKSTQQSAVEFKRPVRKFKYTKVQLNEVLVLCHAAKDENGDVQPSVAHIVREFEKRNPECSIPPNTVRDNLNNGKNGSTNVASGRGGQLRIDWETEREICYQVSFLRCCGSALIVIG